MASGILVHGQCLSQDLGEDVIFSYTAPYITGANSYSIFTKTSSGWQLQNYQNGILQSTTAIETPTLPSCEPSESATDGLILAGSVIAVWASAWAITVLRKVL